MRGLRALLVVLMVPSVAGAAAEDVPPQPGVTLVFPDPAWSDGPAFLAQMQQRLAAPARVAAHFDDLASVDDVRLVGRDMVHSLVRTDGSRDALRLPMVASNPTSLVDVTQLAPALFVRGYGDALIAFLAPSSLPQGHPGGTVSGTDAVDGVTSAAHAVATLFGIPSPDAGAWDAVRRDRCDVDVEVAGGPGADPRSARHYSTGRTFTSWSPEGIPTRHELGLKSCWIVTIGPGDDGTGQNGATIRFTDDPPRIVVHSQYWITKDASGWPSRWALRDAMREGFAWEAGPIAELSRQAEYFDGWSLRVLQQWQANTWPTTARGALFDDPCRIFAFASVFQDPVTSQVVYAELPIRGGGHGCPGTRSLVTPAHVRADRDADHTVRVPVGPYSADAAAFATLLGDAIDAPFPAWTLDPSSKRTALVEKVDDAWRIQIHGPDGAAMGHATVRGDYVARPRSGDPPAPTPAVPTASRDTDPAPMRAPDPGVYTTYLDLPNIVSGSGASRDVYASRGAAGFDDRDTVLEWLGAMGLPHADKGAWTEGVPVDSVPPIHLGQGAQMFVACDCRLFTWTADPSLSNANRVQATVAPDGSVVYLHLPPWIDVSAWALMPPDQAEARARQALTDDLASAVSGGTLWRIVDFADREIDNVWTFEGPDRWGEPRTWKVLQHGHTGQVILVTADPPLFADWGERFFEHKAGGWRLALLVSLAGLFLLLVPGSVRGRA